MFQMCIRDRALIDEGKHYDICVAIGPMIMMKFVTILTKKLEIPTVVSMLSLIHILMCLGKSLHLQIILSFHYLKDLFLSLIHIYPFFS